MPNEVVPFQNLTKDLAAVYQVEPAELVSTVKAMCFPNGAASDPQLFVFLTVAKQLELNPFNREIYAFVSSGKLQTIVGLDGWIKLVNRHPKFSGFEFVDRNDKDGRLVAVTCRMWRNDWKHPGEATEYLAECKGKTDPWEKWPHRMLRNKAYIQCARMTFGFAGIVDTDEGERIEHPENWPSVETTATVVAGASVNTPAVGSEAGADRTDTGKPADAAPSATVNLAGASAPGGATGAIGTAVNEHPTMSPTDPPASTSAVPPSVAENAATGAEERHSSPPTNVGAAPSPADPAPATRSGTIKNARKKLDDLIAKHVTAARLNLLLGQAGVADVKDLSDEQVAAMIAKIESRKGK